MVLYGYRAQNWRTAFSWRNKTKIQLYCFVLFLFLVSSDVGGTWSLAKFLPSPPQWSNKQDVWQKVQCLLLWKGDLPYVQSFELVIIMYFLFSPISKVRDLRVSLYFPTTIINLARSLRFAVELIIIMYFLFSSISEVHDLLVSLYFPATNNQLAMEWFLLMAAFMGFR